MLFYTLFICTCRQCEVSLTVILYLIFFNKIVSCLCRIQARKEKYNSFYTKCICQSIYKMKGYDANVSQWYTCTCNMPSSKVQFTSLYAWAATPSVSMPRFIAADWKRLAVCNLSASFLPSEKICKMLSLQFLTTWTISNVCWEIQCTCK